MNKKQAGTLATEILSRVYDYFRPKGDDTIKELRQDVARIIQAGGAYDFSATTFRADLTEHEATKAKADMFGDLLEAARLALWDMPYGADRVQVSKTIEKAEKLERSGGE